MSLKCGIVGLPNVGKSTLFNALTCASVDAQNYPFCTIDPNTGVVAVPDARLDRIAELVQPQKVLPATTEFVDIAGLVAGASKGDGLGNQFLANIREANAICHVVRCFSDVDVIHVSGQIDPLDDINTINTELALADLSTVENARKRHLRPAQTGDKYAAALLPLLERCEQALNEGQAVRQLNLDVDAQEILKPLCLLTAKPVLYVANLEEDTLVTGNDLLQTVTHHAEQEGAMVVPLSASLEAQIASWSVDEQIDYLQTVGLERPGLHQLIQTAYSHLGLHTYFTAGVKEARAWTIPKGAKAPQAAAAIHSDFERGFIRAEVMHYDDFLQHNGEAGCKLAGKLRVEGKEYTVVDGDIIHFRFNV